MGHTWAPPSVGGWVAMNCRGSCGAQELRCRPQVSGWSICCWIFRSSLSGWSDSQGKSLQWPFLVPQRRQRMSVWHRRSSILRHLSYAGNRARYSPAERPSVHRHADRSCLLPWRGRGELSRGVGSGWESQASVLSSAHHHAVPSFAAFLHLHSKILTSGGAGAACL